MKTINRAEIAGPARSAWHPSRALVCTTAAIAIVSTAVAVYATRTHLRGAFPDPALNATFRYGYAHAALTYCGFQEGLNWESQENLVRQLARSSASPDVAVGFAAFVQAVEERGATDACDHAGQTLGPAGLIARH